MKKLDVVFLFLIIPLLLEGCAALAVANVAGAAFSTGAIVSSSTGSMGGSGSSTYALSSQTSPEEFTNRVRAAARELGFSVNAAPIPGGTATALYLFRSRSGFLTANIVALNVTLGTDGKTVTIDSTAYNSDDKAADALIDEFRKKLEEKYKKA